MLWFTLDWKCSAHQEKVGPGSLRYQIIQCICGYVNGWIWQFLFKRVCDALFFHLYNILLIRRVSAAWSSSKLYCKTYRRATFSYLGSVDALLKVMWPLGDHSTALLLLKTNRCVTYTVMKSSELQLITNNPAVTFFFISLGLLTFTFESTQMEDRSGLVGCSGEHWF